MAPEILIYFFSLLKELQKMLKKMLINKLENGMSF